MSVSKSLAGGRLGIQKLTKWKSDENDFLFCNNLTHRILVDYFSIKTIVCRKFGTCLLFDLGILNVKLSKEQMDVQNE